MAAALDAAREKLRSPDTLTQRDGADDAYDVWYAAAREHARQTLEGGAPRMRDLTVEVLDLLLRHTQPLLADPRTDEHTCSTLCQNAARILELLRTKPKFSLLLLQEPDLLRPLANAVLAGPAAVVRASHLALERRRAALGPITALLSLGDALRRTRIVDSNPSNPVLDAGPPRGDNDALRLVADTLLAPLATLATNPNTDFALRDAVLQSLAAAAGPHGCGPAPALALALLVRARDSDGLRPVWTMGALQSAQCRRTLLLRLARAWDTALAPLLGPDAAHVASLGPAGRLARDTRENLASADPDALAEPRRRDAPDHTPASSIPASFSFLDSDFDRLLGFDTPGPRDRRDSEGASSAGERATVLAAPSPSTAFRSSSSFPSPSSSNATSSPYATTSSSSSSSSSASSSSSLEREWTLDIPVFVSDVLTSLYQALLAEHADADAADFIVTSSATGLPHDPAAQEGLLELLRATDIASVAAFVRSRHHTTTASAAPASASSAATSSTAATESGDSTQNGFHGFLSLQSASLHAEPPIPIRDRPERAAEWLDVVRIFFESGRASTALLQLLLSYPTPETLALLASSLHHLAASLVNETLVPFLRRAVERLNPVGASSHDDLAVVDLLRNLAQSLLHGQGHSHASHATPEHSDPTSTRRPTHGGSAPTSSENPAAPSSVSASSPTSSSVAATSSPSSHATLTRTAGVTLVRCLWAAMALGYAETERFPELTARLLRERIESGSDADEALAVLVEGLGDSTCRSVPSTRAVVETVLTLLGAASSSFGQEETLEVTVLAAAASDRVLRHIADTRTHGADAVWQELLLNHTHLLRDRPALIHQLLDAVEAEVTGLRGQLEDDPSLRPLVASGADPVLTTGATDIRRAAAEALVRRLRDTAETLRRLSLSDTLASVAPHLLAAFINLLPLMPSADQLMIHSDDAVARIVDAAGQAATRWRPDPTAPAPAPSTVRPEAFTASSPTTTPTPPVLTPALVHAAIRAGGPLTRTAVARWFPALGLSDPSLDVRIEALLTLQQASDTTFLALPTVLQVLRCAPPDLAAMDVSWHALAPWAFAQSTIDATPVSTAPDEQPWTVFVPGALVAPVRGFDSTDSLRAVLVTALPVLERVALLAATHPASPFDLHTSVAILTSVLGRILLAAAVSAGESPDGRPDTRIVTVLNHLADALPPPLLARFATDPVGLTRLGLLSAIAPRWVAAVDQLVRGRVLERRRLPTPPPTAALHATTALPSTAPAERAPFVSSPPQPSAPPASDTSLLDADDIALITATAADAAEAASAASIAAHGPLASVESPLLIARPFTATQSGLTAPSSSSAASASFPSMPSSTATRATRDVLPSWEDVVGRHDEAVGHAEWPATHARVAAVAPPPLPSSTGDLPGTRPSSSSSSSSTSSSSSSSSSPLAWLPQWTTSGWRYGTQGAVDGYELVPLVPAGRDSHTELSLPTPTGPALGGGVALAPSVASIAGTPRTTPSLGMPASALPPLGAAAAASFVADAVQFGFGVASGVGPASSWGFPAFPSSSASTAPAPLPDLAALPSVPVSPAHGRTLPPEHASAASRPSGSRAALPG